MSSQNHNLKYHPTTNDSKIKDEVMAGLRAAKHYEENKTRPSLAASEEMMRMNFPRIPSGDISKQISEDEYTQLRTSMQETTNDKTAQSIANVRVQLTEYHSLLDKLSSVVAKYDALEKEFRVRRSRIQSLEEEVVVLTMKNAQSASTESDTPRRVSYSAIHGNLCVGCTGTQGRNAGASIPMQTNQMLMQQMQGPPNSGFFQTNVSCLNQNPTPSSSSDAKEPFMMAPIHVSNHELPPKVRQNASPLPPPRDYYQLPNNSGLCPAYYSSSSYQDDNKQVDRLESPTWPKRSISNECYDSSTGMTRSREQDAKRFKNDHSPYPECMTHSYFPEAS